LNDGALLFAEGAARKKGAQLIVGNLFGASLKVCTERVIG